MLLLTIGVVTLHAFLLAGTQGAWNDSRYVLFMLSAYVLLQPVTMVCVIALAMSICATRVSATQFAVYMSMANLGLSFGSESFGRVAEYASFAQNYALLGALAIVMLGVIGLFRRPAPIPAG